MSRATSYLQNRNASRMRAARFGYPFSLMAPGFWPVPVWSTAAAQDQPDDPGHADPGEADGTRAARC